ncbi:uncharacterized protein LOC128201961 [Galleria mellonella]|uniref:Uncharacterized protein LOC128201961 n=1 Tax=Galleria mellonella TaxID=7137 RepID=A0ABM3MYT5_GALME|nr:uncharacterized protein LOC128201961 [Galleria mellonella]
MAGVNKIKRKEWSSEHMTEAIKLVREKKMGYLRAAKHFDVPRSTLFRLCQKNELPPEEAATTALGRKTVLGTTLENLLVDYILTMDSKFHGLTRNDVRRMAYMLARRNQLENSFGKTGMAGKKWLKLFLKRHKKKLSVRRPTGTSFARAFGFSKEKMDSFFDLLEGVYVQGNYRPNRIYNVDESAIANLRTPDGCVPLTEAFTSRQDTNTEPVPSTSGLSGSSLGLVSPYEINPVPNKKRKPSNRGRKASVASVITSSPYKNDLIDKNKKKRRKRKQIGKE